MVSIEPELNTVNTEHVNLNIDVESVVVDCDNLIEFPISKIKQNTELTALIENNDQTVIPINAVLTRSKARQLNDAKLPNLLLQIPDISPEKFKEMQKSDKGLDRYWGIAQGEVTQDEGLKASYLI